MKLQDGVYQLKQTSKLQNGVEFPSGQEIEVVMGVIYIGGFPLPPNMQATMYNWMESNPNLFNDTTKNW